MSSPPVSVVIPVYNRETLIAASIQSVLAQTFSDFELLVVDDASTDATVEVICAIQDPRLRVILQKTRGGAAGARNTGLREARGEWVAFHDSDDRWLPRKLEAHCALLHPAPSDLVASFTSYFCHAGSRCDILPRPRLCSRLASGHLHSLLCRGNFISTQTLMVHRRIALDLGGFIQEYSPLEDWEFAIRLSLRGRIQHIPEPLVDYILQADSITHHLDAFVTAYRRIWDAHVSELAPTRAAAAWHSAVMGNRLCRENATREGRRWLARATRCAPWDPRYFALWARSFLPRRCPCPSPDSNALSKTTENIP